MKKLAPHAQVRTGWSLASYGGSTATGTKVVYAAFRDAAGNWSLAVSDEIEYQGSSGGGGGGGGAAGLDLLVIASVILLATRARR